MDNPATLPSAITMSKWQWDKFLDVNRDMLLEMEDLGIITFYDAVDVEELKKTLPDLGNELLEKGIISPEGAIDFSRMVAEMPTGTYASLIGAELVSSKVGFDKDLYDEKSPELFEKYGSLLEKVIEFKDLGPVLKAGTTGLSAGMQLPIDQSPLGIYLNTDGDLNLEFDRDLFDIELSKTFSFNSNFHLHYGLNTDEYSIGLRTGFNHHSANESDQTFSYNGSSIYLGAAYDNENAVTGFTSKTSMSAGERTTLYGRFDASYRFSSEETNFSTSTGATYKIIDISDLFQKLNVPITLPLGQIEAYASYDCQGEELSDLECDTHQGIRWELHPN